MLTLTIALVASALFAPPAAVPAEAGEAGSLIVVIPDGARPTVRRAANEVARYLKRITGTEIPVVAEKDARPGIRIDVGPTQNAQKYLPKDLLGDEERVLVRTVPGGVIICGGGDRGTLYAAYRFLESLGCRWLTPEPEDEVVPQARAIQLSDLHIDTRPAFEWRLFSASSSRLEQWGLKMGFNGLYPPETAVTNGGSFHWPQRVQGVHAFAELVPAERYFMSHPEWFSLLGGKRAVSVGAVSGQLCVTAPGLAEEFASNVIRVFDADPNARLISISPNDGYGWCECFECMALDRKLCGGRSTKQGLAIEQPFMGDRLFWFCNEVAARVGQKYPDRKLLVLAYVNYAEPPDTIRPAGNIVPFICHYAPADYSRPVSDPASEANRQFDDLLQRWVSVSSEVMIYSYIRKSMWWRLPRPVLGPFAADVKYYHLLGIRRYYCQSSLSDWALDGPLYYVIARLLWDPTADPKAIADEWIHGMFGPAATDMATYYDAVAQSVQATGQSYSDDPPGQVPGLFDHSKLDLAMAAITRAEKIPSSDLVHGRIQRVAATFRSGYWMIHALEEDRFGDPLMIRWLTAIVYLTGVLSCGVVWASERRVRLEGQTATASFWMIVSLLLLCLWIDKYAHLQTLLIDFGRQLTQTQSWYKDRQIRKTIFFAVASVAGMAALGSFWWLAHRQWKRTLLALLGTVVLCAFLLIRASSFHDADRASWFHQMDVAFRMQFDGLSCRWVVEFGAISIVVAGAALALSGRGQRDGAAPQPTNSRTAS